MDSYKLNYLEDYPIFFVDGTVTHEKLFRRAIHTQPGLAARIGSNNDGLTN